MFKRFGGSSGIWKPKNPHSLEYLKYLHGILMKNERVTEHNRTLLVEALRAIAEILIWGDQNDSSVFDFEKILFWKFQSTQEFPLYTEAIKFYNHSEGMVRIAVRTTTLNIFKGFSFSYDNYFSRVYFPLVMVEDELMRTFVRNKSRDYFCAVVDLTAFHSIDIDQFARSAENESSNRDRLCDLICENLDHIHYLNDIFLIKDEHLSAVLSEIVFRRLLAPLYLCSLASLRICPNAIILSPVSSLFLLSQFLLVVTDSQAVQTLLSSFFFGDGSDVRQQWSRSQPDAKLILVNLPLTNTTSNRVFFNSYLKSLNCERNDHAAFFGLLFLYAICQNKGVMAEILTAAQITPSMDCELADSEHGLLEVLLSILSLSTKSDTVVRVVTVELCCMILRQLLLAVDIHTTPYSRCEAVADQARNETILSLSNVLYNEDLFLEMFEDEYYQFERDSFRISLICDDPCLLLPPSNTPLSGVPLNKRLPSGSEERIRRTIQLYFHFRKFVLDLRDESETQLPLSTKGNTVVEVNDCINLENSDLLSCTVVLTKGERHQRFLVADQLQLILVEPDTKRLGWANVRFVGLLQDTQLTGDPGESRALHVVVNDARTRSHLKNEPLLSAKFLFEDHIRCMAAKQRLTKGRQAARHMKLDLICDVLGLPKRSLTPGSNRNPFRIVKGCAPGSLRRQSQQLQIATTSSSGPSSGKSSTTSLNIVPDDPKPAPATIPSSSSAASASTLGVRNANGIQDLDILTTLLCGYYSWRYSVNMAEAASSSTQIPSDSFPCIIVLGMAGSGKSSFVQRLTARLHEKKSIPYVINLDPAVNTVPYPANIDIRDTVKYKEVMREYGLGPNGAIMTCLNLICTRFDQVLTLVNKRAGVCSHCLIDTPGQIEAFTWSASGTIITDSLASANPTMIAYVMDSVRATNPITFMSNMLYACSIFYRTKLPFIIVLNKADIVRPTFATKWMRDFESFQQALDENSSTYMNDLTRSLSLVLDQFYENFSAVPVSSLTGEGIDEFLEAVKKCTQEYYDVYRPMYEKLAKDKVSLKLLMKHEEEENVEKLSNLTVKERELLSVNPPEAGRIFEKIHLGGVDEENEEDSEVPR
ncbi:unnamed protein product [Anisakis simplex]|uniref:GPN-loop GTPase 1 n=1 Tax=Anisakis simplex TaxID=6269 RepID=A0A0M3K132_ANISI|nr:unnamed protein product [Anisakis simplex]